MSIKKYFPRNKNTKNIIIKLYNIYSNSDPQQFIYIYSISIYNT